MDISMGWLAAIGWLLALAFGLGWWLEHRGMAGIRSDLADAEREIQKRLQK